MKITIAGLVLAFGIQVSSSFAAVTEVGTAATQSNTTSQATMSVSHDSGSTGSSRMTAAKICWRSGSNNISAGPTYGGNAMTLHHYANDGGLVSTAIYYLLSPPTGSNPFSVTMSAGDNGAIAVQTYSGVNQSTPFGTPATAAGSSGAASVTVSSASGDLVLDAVCRVDGESMTVDGSQTEIAQDGGSIADASTRRIGVSKESGAASVSMDWTWASSLSWHHIGTSIIAAAAAADMVQRRRTQ